MTKAKIESENCIPVGFDAMTLTVDDHQDKIDSLGKTVVIGNPADYEYNLDVVEPASGCFLLSYTNITLAAYVARNASISIIIPLMGMKNLNQTLSGLLLISPLVPNMLTQIPLTWRINKNGGKKEGIIMMSLTLVGMISLTVLCACTDISTINSVDWRYAVLFGSGYLIGHGAGASLLMIDTLKWVPKKSYIPNFQLLYSFLVDSTSVTGPLMTYCLSLWGYYVPFAFYTGLILLGGIIALSINSPSPYLQFKRTFQHERAKQLAVEAGQLEELITNYDEYSFKDLLRENLSVLMDRRSLILGFTFFASLGNFFVSRTILPRFLGKGFGLSTGEAVLISSLANLATLFSRPIASKLITRWDSESRGLYVFLLGCGLAIAGSVALAVGNLPRWGFYLSLASNNIGFGINMTAALSIATAWTHSVDGMLNEVSPSTMFGLFGTLGSVGGVLLPVILGLFIDISGHHWYKLYFYSIVAMMIILAIGVPAVNYQMSRKPEEHFFQSTLSFFTKSPSNNKEQPNTFGNAVQNNKEVETSERIYVEAFF